MSDINTLALPVGSMTENNSLLSEERSSWAKMEKKLARQLSSASSSQETVIFVASAANEPADSPTKTRSGMKKWFFKQADDDSFARWDDEEIKRMFRHGQQLEFVYEQVKQEKEGATLTPRIRKKSIGWKGVLLGFGAGALTVAGSVAAYFSGRWSDSKGEMNQHRALSDFTPEPDAEMIAGYSTELPFAERLQMSHLKNNSRTLPSETQAEYNSEALIKLESLNDYSRLNYDKRLPESLRYLADAGLINRDFYNRYLYPMLLDASARLQENSRPVNGKNLMAELVKIISAAILRLEELNIAHAIRIDPFYDKLTLLSRELRKKEKIVNATASHTQMVNTKWLARKLREAITLSELDELKQEAKTLIKYYSRANNLNANYHFGNKLRAVTDKINYALYQLVRKLNYSGVDKYLTDYFSSWLLNLDKESCNDIKENNLHPDECRLFEGIGFALFRNKDNSYIHPASLLIANKIFIPRLKQIINAAHLRISSSEHRFIELLLCDISSQQDILFCSGDNAPNLSLTGKTNGAPSTITNGEHSVTTKEIEEYVVKPVPFDGEMPYLLAEVGAGIGAATGTVVGAGGISVAVWQNEKGLKALEKLDVNDNGSIRTEIFPDTGSNAESNVASESSGADTKRGKDLDAFPPISFPPLEHRDHMLFWNTRARDEFKGKDFIVTRGITREVSGDVPEYITQTQARLRAGFAETAGMIKNLRANLRAKLDARHPDPEYLRYITEYFSKAIDTEDTKIIDMCITRFRESIDAVDEFFKKTRDQEYRNIFIISTRQQETAVKGQYASLLTEEELATVPDAMTSRSSNPTIAIVCDQTELVNPVHVEHSRRGMKNNIADTLTHEATHAALGAHDFFYPPRTPQGRSVNAKEAYRSLKSSLQDMGIQKDLKEAIMKFTKENGIASPFSSDSSLNSESSVDANRIMALLRDFPKFRAYVLTTNAENIAIYARDIGRGVSYDAAPPQ